MKKMKEWRNTFITCLFVMLFSAFLFPLTVRAQDVDASKYFYNQLTAVEKTIYNTFVNKAAINLEKDDLDKAGKGLFYTIKSSKSMSLEEWSQHMLRAEVALRADTADFYTIYHFGQYSISEDGKTLTGTMEPKMTADSYYRNQAKARYSQIISTVGTTGDRYTKLRKLYDIMRSSMRYDADYTDETSELKNFFNVTMLGCLTNGEAICSGFSETFKYCCDGLGIPCIEVGNSVHQWNYVQMEDGNWYAVDMSAAVANSGNKDYQEGLLLGSETSSYKGNSSYSASSLYLGQEGDFTFPVLAKQQYQYTGQTTDFSYTLAANSFDAGGNCKKSGHKWDAITLQLPSCENKGNYYCVCQTCGVKKQINVFPQYQHECESITDGIYNMQKCMMCNKVISKKKVTLAKVSIRKLTAKKKGFTVQWKKSKDKNVKYQIQYAVKSNFKGAKTVNGKTATKKTISRLKKKKTYYVRVRTYRKGKSGGKTVTIYSKWSKAKKVKTK